MGFFSITLPYKFTYESVSEKNLKSVVKFSKVTGKKDDCLEHPILLSIVYREDKEWTRRAATVVTVGSGCCIGMPIDFDWCQQISNWCRPILTCRMTPSVDD